MDGLYLFVESDKRYGMAVFGVLGFTALVAWCGSCWSGGPNPMSASLVVRFAFDRLNEMKANSQDKVICGDVVSINKFSVLSRFSDLAYCPF